MQRRTPKAAVRSRVPAAQSRPAVTLEEEGSVTGFVRLAGIVGAMLENE